MVILTAIIKDGCYLSEFENLAAINFYVGEDG
jgi:hypothetical protein